MGRTRRSDSMVLTVVDSVVVGSVVLIVVVEGAMVLVVLVGGAVVEGVPVVVVVVVVVFVLPMGVLGEVIMVVVRRAIWCASLSAVPMGRNAAEVGEGRVVVGWSLAFLEGLFCLLVLLLIFLLVLRTTGGAAGELVVV